ncbi:hypothetical protein Tco_1555804 [Tanacetum coccineum]
MVARMVGVAVEGDDDVWWCMTWGCCGFGGVASGESRVMGSEGEDISRNSISRIKFNKWEELAEKLMRWTTEYGTQSLVRR